MLSDAPLVAIKPSLMMNHEWPMLLTATAAELSQYQNEVLYSAVGGADQSIRNSS